jgi:formylglycine-generating enzyme required for sulfatase activity
MLAALLMLAACAPPEEDPTPEPTVEEAEPTEEMAEPTEEMAEPTEEMAEPTEEMAEPTEEMAEPTAEPTAEEGDGDDGETSGSYDDAAFSSPATNDEWEPVVETFNGVEFVLVPTGTFTMGRPGSNLTAPEHEQTIENPFWIARTETTVGQYEAAGFDASGLFLQGEDEPVGGIAWEDAQEYCASIGGRLPSEPEWAYAARGPQSWLFPNNATAAEQAEDGYGAFVYGAYNSAIAVPTFTENAVWTGAYDMLGNVSEWTISNLRPYPYDADDGREALEPAEGSNGQGRTHRGGSYQTTEDDLSLAVREFWQTPNQNVPFQVGMRCVIDYGAEPGQ